MTDNLIKIGLAVGAILLGLSVFGNIKSCQEYKALEAEMEKKKQAEEKALERVDSLKSIVSKLTSKNDSIDSLLVDVQTRNDSLEQHNDSLADSLRRESERLDDDVVEAGESFEKAYQRVRRAAAPRVDSLLTELKATHTQQVNILQRQVAFEKHRANTNRETIEALREENALLVESNSTKDSIISAQREAISELEAAVTSAQERALRWKVEARPGFLGGITKNIGSHTAAAAFGAAMTCFAVCN